jgi:predicted RNA binding protein YcfA (HicA-like mRNA interferase family)
MANRLFAGYKNFMNSRQIITRLKKEGWILVHIKGSHHQYKHPDNAGRVTVPHPEKDLPIGTVRNIYRQAGWPWPEK